MGEQRTYTWRGDYSPPAYLVPKIDLYFDIRQDVVEVRSRLQMQRNPQAKAQPFCTLHGENLELRWLELDGQRLLSPHYHYDQQEALLTLVNPPDRFVLGSCVRIDPYRNKALSGLYQSGAVLCSQNESEGFRRITFFPDRPDVMSLFSCQIEADRTEFPVLLSNGNLVQTAELEHGRHQVKWHDPYPKPCYLFAVVAGRLESISDQFTTASGRRVELRIYTDPGKSHLAQFAMISLKKAMAWDEQNFGREYDLDLFMIVAVDSFNYGAMENKGLNIFNSRLVFADSTLATDADFRAVERVVAHEYFHNWTGNRITCRDWFQLTLKEGLTVYRDEEFSADQTDSTAKRVADVEFLRRMQYPEDASANRHPIRPDRYLQISNFYTSTVYRKGAAVIRMIAEHVGKERFRKGMDLYFQRFDGMAVTCDDFLDAIEEGSGCSLNVFRAWYSQAGTPRVDVTLRMEQQGATLVLRQTNPACGHKAPPLGIPFPLTLYHRSGAVFAERKVLLKEWEQRLHFPHITEKPVPSLLTGHIAPVLVDYPYEDDELLMLLAHDRDPFNRYEAGRRLYLRFILQMCDQPDFSPPERLWQTLSLLLESSQLSPEYRALLLSLPSVRELSDLQAEPQFALVWQQKQRFARMMAHALPCRTWFEKMENKDPRYSPQLASCRRLRAVTASLLAAAGESELIKAYQRGAVNMTEELHGLSLLTHYFPGKETECALTACGQRWRDHPLLLCKWFTLQANNPSPHTVEKVEQLAHDPGFQRQVPNMINALYGGFAANLPAFHRPDGQGYRLLADEVMRVDTFNPLTASRLAKKFLDFPRLPSPQKERMGAELHRMLDERRGLSSCCYEPISAILSEE